MTSRETSVLVVEDDVQALNLERLILEGGGYTVSWAARGEDAIEMVADDPPDLVLLDIGLPGIDGFTTCKVIRKFSRVPIVMVTGCDSGDAKVKGLDSGADDYITKPFSEAELVARSRAVLRRSGPASLVSPLAAPFPRNVVQSLRKFDYPKKIREIGQTAGRWSSNLAARASKSARVKNVPASSPRAAFLWPGWLALLAAGGLLRVGALKLAGFLQIACRRASESPLAQRVKGSQPTARLADAAARIRRSEAAGRIGARASRIRETGISAAQGFLGRRQKGQLPGPKPVPELFPPVYPPERAELSLTGEIDHAPEITFLEELLQAYLKEAATRCADPMVSSPVLPLVDVYQRMISLSRREGQYSRQQFARDVFRLHSSGVDATPTGARVQFPISRGVPNKTLIVVDDAGGEVKYYGVRFLQTSGEGCLRPAPGRSFDSSEAARYRWEIQEAFRQQLEWPSEAFARLLAAQLNFDRLDQREVRLFAQLTRDSLQELVDESADEGTTPEAAG